MYRAGVVGASGYAGGELLRIITTHNSLALVCATSSNYVGESISNLALGGGSALFRAF